MSTNKSSFHLQAFSKFLYNENFNWEARKIIVKEFGQSLETEARLEYKFGYSISPKQLP